MYSFPFRAHTPVDKREEWHVSKKWLSFQPQPGRCRALTCVAAVGPQLRNRGPVINLGLVHLSTAQVIRVAVWPTHHIQLPLGGTNQHPSPLSTPVSSRALGWTTEKQLEPSCSVCPVQLSPGGLPQACSPPHTPSALPSGTGPSASSWVRWTSRCPSRGRSTPRCAGTPPCCSPLQARRYWPHVQRHQCSPGAVALPQLTRSDELAVQLGRAQPRARVLHGGHGLLDEVAGLQLEAQALQQPRGARGGALGAVAAVQEDHAQHPVQHGQAQVRVTCGDSTPPPWARGHAKGD